MPVPDAIARCEELREANHDDRVLEAVIERCLAHLVAMAGRFDEAREYDRRSSLVLNEANMRTPTRVSKVIAAEMRELVGDRPGAERELQEKWFFSRDILGAGSPPGHGMGTASILVTFYCDEGRWADAEEIVAFYRGAPDPVDVRTFASWSSAEARLAAHRGELEEALRRAQRAVAILEPTDLLHRRAEAWLALAKVQRVAGNADAADAAVTAAIEIHNQKGNVAAAARLRSDFAVADGPGRRMPRPGP
jgi:tetratricopeptide (TPR) repeat protein